MHSQGSTGCFSPCLLCSLTQSRTAGLCVWARERVQPAPWWAPDWHRPLQALARAAPCLRPRTGDQRWAPQTGRDVSFEAGANLGCEQHKPTGPRYLETSGLRSKLPISLPGKIQRASKKYPHFQNTEAKVTFLTHPDSLGCCLFVTVL